MTLVSANWRTRGWSRLVAVSTLAPLLGGAQATQSTEVRRVDRTQKQPARDGIDRHIGLTRLPRQRIWGFREEFDNSERDVNASRSARNPGGEKESSRGVLTVAFGDDGSLLRCTILRACIVELEAGESLLEPPIAGDHARWIIATARTGSRRRNTLVVLKPKACGIATNLVLSTDRRIYDLDLESPSCRKADGISREMSARHLRFTYPTVDIEMDSSTRTSGLRSGGNELGVVKGSAPSSTDVSAAIEPPVVNRDYAVLRKRRGPFGLLGQKPSAFPWEPSEIRDDGLHVYVTLPPEARRHPAPVLYSIEDDGSRTIMNFTARDSVVVTDRVFRRGIFVIASGRIERTLEFENRAWGKGSSSTKVSR